MFPAEIWLKIVTSATVAKKMARVSKYFRALFHNNFSGIGYIWEATEAPLAWRKIEFILVHHGDDEFRRLEKLAPHFPNLCGIVWQSPYNAPHSPELSDHLYRLKHIDLAILDMDPVPLHKFERAESIYISDMEVDISGPINAKHVSLTSCIKTYEDFTTMIKSNVGPVEKFSLSNNILHSLEPFSKVTILCLSYCPFPNLAPMKCLKKAKFEYCVGNVDLQPVEGVSCISIRSCNGITDVSPLKDVPFIAIKWCENITDVSSLKSATYLNLTGCRNLTNVDMLGHVTTLKLDATGVTDVSQLGNVPHLHLAATKVTDVSKLGNHTTLRLSSTDVESVKTLGHVKYLDLERTKVKDLRPLTHVKRLIISGCDDIEEFPLCFSGEHLVAFDCPAFARDPPILLPGTTLFTEMTIFD